MNKKMLLAVPAAIMLMLTGAVIARASIPSPTGAVNGCYTTTTQAGVHGLGVVDSTVPCPAGTVALNWNQTGPQGPQGPVGPGFYNTTDFSAGNIDHHDFRYQNLANDNFSPGQLPLGQFNTISFQNTQFDRATLTGANFVSDNISGATFTSADLTGAHFRGWTGSAPFDNSVINNVDFTTNNYVPQTTWVSVRYNAQTVCPNGSPVPDGGSGSGTTNGFKATCGL